MARRKPSERRNTGDDKVAEPDLTPIMNLTFMLILALLTTISLVPLGFISVQAPKVGGSGSGAAEKPKEKPLNLTVVVKSEGYNIAASGATLDGTRDGRPGETLCPKVKGQFDTSRLSSELDKIKTAFPEEVAVIIMADEDIDYGDIVKTMDAARVPPKGSSFEELFPAVTFSPGVLGA